jgi:hypothetical protein
MVKPIHAATRSTKGDTVYEQGLGASIITVKAAVLPKQLHPP